MEITVDRMKHSMAVAKKMKIIVAENEHVYMISPDEAFILGILHDIGYEFSEKQQEHANKGGMILKEQGYRFWKEIFYHGTPQKEYDSAELWLLNFVDMITGPKGESMTISHRISDIADRYGKGSLQETEAIKLAEQIKMHASYLLENEPSL